MFVQVKNLSIQEMYIKRKWSLSSKNINEPSTEISLNDDNINKHGSS